MSVYLSGGRIKDELLYGRDYAWWIDTFFVCYDFDGETLRFAQWPDGKSYYEQDNYIISIFKVIRQATSDKVRAEHRKRIQRQRQQSKGRKHG